MKIDSCGFLNMEGSRYLTDSKLDGSLVDIMQVTSVAPWFNDKKDMLEYLSLCVYQINSNEKLVVFTNKNQVTHNVQTKIILGLQNPPKHQNSDSTHFHTSLEELFKAGVRVTTIAYDRKNDYGSGFLEPSNGLTSLGNVFLDFCDSIGMIVDLSHAGYKTIDDILLRDEQPKKPFVATHVACQGVFRTDRNLSDEHLKKIADAGGCIGIMFLTFALDEKNNSMSTAVSHFKHAINLCGEDAVGVGSDGPYISTSYDEIIGHSKMLGSKLDSDGKMGSRAPHHPLELYHPYKLHVIERMLHEEFGSRIAEKIIGLNWKRYLDEFFPE